MVDCRNVEVNVNIYVVFNETDYSHTPHLALLIEAKTCYDTVKEHLDNVLINLLILVVLLPCSMTVKIYFDQGYRL